MRIRRLVSLAAAALVCAAPARAAVAVSPISDEPTTSHPVLTWFLGPGETSSIVTISSSPKTTPDGSFYDENVVDLGLAADAATRWAPTEALYAGHYWWSVKTYDADINAHQTPPEEFHVMPRLRLTGMRITRWEFLREVDFDPNVQTNTGHMRYAVKVRALKTRRLLRRFGGVFDRFTTIEWHARRNIAQGRRVRVEITISGASRKVVWRRIMRAP